MTSQKASVGQIKTVVNSLKEASDTLQSGVKAIASKIMSAAGQLTDCFKQLTSIEAELGNQLTELEEQIAEAKQREQQLLARWKHLTTILDIFSFGTYAIAQALDHYKQEKDIVMQYVRQKMLLQRHEYEYNYDENSLQITLMIFH